MEKRKYTIRCFLTSKGWQLAHDYDKMAGEPVRLQRDFHVVIDTLAEKMSKRDGRQPAFFKIRISFRPRPDRKSYLQSIDYKAAKYCPAKYARLGMELCNLLAEELNK